MKKKNLPSNVQKSKIFFRISNLTASQKRREKYRVFITSRNFNIEKVSKSSWDTVHGWIKWFYFQKALKILRNHHGSVNVATKSMEYVKYISFFEIDQQY